MPFGSVVTCVVDPGKIVFDRGFSFPGKWNFELEILSHNLHYKL